MTRHQHLKGKLESSKPVTHPRIRVLDLGVEHIDMCSADRCGRELGEIEHAPSHVNDLRLVISLACTPVVHEPEVVREGDDPRVARFVSEPLREGNVVLE